MNNKVNDKVNDKELLKELYEAADAVAIDARLNPTKNHILDAALDKLAEILDKVEPHLKEQQCN